MNYNWLVRKPINIILAINDGNYIAQITKKVGVAHGYTNEVLKIFMDNNIITTTKEGRIKKVYLTKKGKKLRDYFQKIIEDGE